MKIHNIKKMIAELFSSFNNTRQIITMDSITANQVSIYGKYVTIDELENTPTLPEYMKNAPENNIVPEYVDGELT